MTTNLIPQVRLANNPSASDLGALIDGLEFWQRAGATSAMVCLKPQDVDSVLGPLHNPHAWPLPMRWGLSLGAGLHGYPDPLDITAWCDVIVPAIKRLRRWLVYLDAESLIDSFVTRPYTPFDFLAFRMCLRELPKTAVYLWYPGPAATDDKEDERYRRETIWNAVRDVLPATLLNREIDKPNKWKSDTPAPNNPYVQMYADTGLTRKYWTPQAAADGPVGTLGEHHTIVLKVQPWTAWLQTSKDSAAAWMEAVAG